ncbi:glycoside hydrolase family 13 protein [Multifurca ochricompacta]|uniref:alpha-amylase n=1 Tax=Multifurca ochricompacta TaxID=376703 RepID=A0AAD4M453_9AGAM|nr:glycoside hydrolase family 13 protein [Multifurca ochricompacta]
MLVSLATSIFGVIFSAAPVLAANATEWSSRSIYQLITDRFATSDDTPVPCDTGARKYCGGSWKGVTNHLDYIQSMGFDAIWISPVSANLEGATSRGEAFHGYWTKDLDSLNPHFGTAEDLRALSEALHGRRMYLMLDVVVNHMAAPALPGNNFTFEGFFHPFTNESYFHKQCFVAESPDPSNQTAVEQCWLGDNDLPLPDINTEDPDVVKTLLDWIHNLVQDYGVDGLRIDTVKHIRRDFWPDFANAAGVYTLGEVLINDTSYAAQYTEVVDAILDYPSYFQLANAFLNTEGRFSSLAHVMTSSQQSYKHGLFRTASFVENHDQPRLASLTKDQSLIRNAMTFPFVHDGIPIVYYGQEQGYQGGADPYNREALWFTAYQQDKPLVQHIKIMNAARKEAIEFSPSFLTTPMKLLAVEDHSMAVSKPPMLALFTNIGSENSRGVTWHVDAVFPPNELLVDVLTCSKVVADQQGGVTVPCAYGMPQVLMPAASLRQGGTVCPEVATRVRAKSASLPGVRVTWAVVMASGLFFVLCKSRWMW